jgi:iron complex transport system permease protein
VHTLLLAGVAANALTGAAVGFFVFVATDAQVRSLMFWTLGSLSGAAWHALGIMGLLCIPCLFLLVRQGRALNLLLLGEAEAYHLGANVERLKRGLLVGISLAVGACVAFVGIIGFVGLVVPHIMRLLVGADHRRLLPVSLLAGACVLLFADIVSRTAALPAEVPIGVVTSALGGPFFIWLLRNQRPN